MKPDNLLLVSFSTDKDAVRAKLSDFGTTKNSLRKNTATKQVGTPGFIAPEVFPFPFYFPFQIITGKEYGKKCDVYSFGMTSWSIDAEEYPFSEIESDFLLYSKVVNEERPPLNPSCKMNDIICSCWVNVNILFFLHINYFIVNLPSLGPRKSSRI